jgi:hypothetical protein
MSRHCRESKYHDFRIEFRLRRPLILDNCVDASIALIAAIGARLCVVTALLLVLHVLVHRMSGMRRRLGIRLADPWASAGNAAHREQQYKQFQD